MNITVNGEAQVVGDEATVGEVVDAVGKGRKGVAVARNEEIVPRSTWDDVRCREGDRLEVLTAAQGG